MAKGEEPGSVQEGLLRGQKEGRPDGPGQRFAVLTQEVQELGLGQTPPGRSQEGHAFPHQVWPLPLVIRLIPSQDELIKLLHPGGREVMVQAGFQGVMVPLHPQLLQQGPEIQGVGAGWRPSQARQLPGAQFLGVLGQVCFY